MPHQTILKKLHIFYFNQYGNNHNIFNYNLPYTYKYNDTNYFNYTNDGHGSCNHDSNKIIYKRYGYGDLFSLVLQI